MDDQEAYWKFAESEQHFNGIQAGIRNLASGWMLAAFGAIALLLKVSTETLWLVHPAVLIGVVCCMATLGLLVLWILDELVYERLLNSIFLVGLKQEFENKTLPPIRLMMLWSTKGEGMSKWMAWFFCVPMAAFCVISLVALVLRETLADGKMSEGVVWATVMLIALLVVEVVATGWVWNQAKKVPSGERVGALGCPKVEALFERASKESTIPPESDRKRDVDTNPNSGNRGSKEECT